MFCPGRDGGHGGGLGRPKSEDPEVVALSIERSGGTQGPGGGGWVGPRGSITSGLPSRRPGRRCWPSFGADRPAADVLQQVGPVRGKDPLSLSTGPNWKSCGRAHVRFQIPTSVLGKNGTFGAFLQHWRDVLEGPEQSREQRWTRSPPS